MTSPQFQFSSNENFIPKQSRELSQRRKSSARWLQIILDQIMVVCLLVAHINMKGLSFDGDYRILAVLTVLLMAVLYQSNDVYNFTLSLFDRFIKLAQAWLLVLVFIVFIGFVTKTSSHYSREVILSWSITGFLAQFIAYLFVNMLQVRSRREVIPTLMIGSRELGQHLAAHINNNQWIPDQVVCAIEDREPQQSQWTLPNVPVDGTLDDIDKVIKARNIRRVYIALPIQQSELIKPIYLNLVTKNIDVIWAPDIFGINLLNYSIHDIAGVPLITLAETPLIGNSAFVKATMDYSIAATALVLAAPLMLLTAMIIKLTSTGPVFFSQQRHGFNGRIITIYKFRSMEAHDEKEGKITQATKNDERVNWFGKILRKTSIDELPQLFNVLNGSMSIVGPRPHPINLNKYYEPKIRDYMARHRVKPGLTGLAQVNGFRGETQTLESMEGRVQLDLAYINSWSPWLDIKIMFRTVFVLLGKNVY